MPNILHSYVLGGNDHAFLHYSFEQGIDKDGAYLQVQWRRVILDEAHSIKDRRCSTAKAVFALDSKYKWALSGTPLQV